MEKFIFEKKYRLSLAWKVEEHFSKWGESRGLYQYELV